MDLGRVVGEAVVRAERDVKRRARRWEACILAAVCWYLLLFLSFRDIWFCSQEDGKYQDVRKRTW